MLIQLSLSLGPTEGFMAAPPEHCNYLVNSSEFGRHPVIVSSSNSELFGTSSSI